MIGSFRHKGLERFFRVGSRAGILPAHAARLRIQLTALEHSLRPGDMNMPGWRFHSLKGALDGYFAVRVSGNWRLMFRFEAGNAESVDYLDYH